MAKTIVHDDMQKNYLAFKRENKSTYNVKRRYIICD